jgi:uncharacterized protein (TIGR02246 family)
VADHARELYEWLIAAWNDRDAGAFADLFAPDGVMIGFDGSVAVGPEIQSHLAPVFEDHPTAAYYAKLREVRPLGSDVVLLRAIVGMLPPGADELNSTTNAHHSLVAGRTQEEGWSIVLFQNTPAQFHGRPELVQQHTDEIEAVRASGATVA